MDMNVYLGNINEYSIENLKPLVSSDRYTAAMRFRFDEDKKRTLLAHALLAYAVRQNHPDMVLPLSTQADEYGKPHLYINKGQDEIHFSLSHSGDHSVCVLADSPVGIDIEKSGDNKEDIASRFFHKEDLKYINDSESFFRIWTLKESYIKAVGLGMRIPLDSFCIRDLDTASGRCLFYDQNEGKYCKIKGISMIIDGYALAVSGLMDDNDTLSLINTFVA